MDRHVSAFADAAGNELVKDQDPELMTQRGVAIRTIGPRVFPLLDRELRATDSKLGLARYNLHNRFMNWLLFES